ncbi:MAG TPA: hypothetical protein DEH02_18660 [Bacteroidales bacterium]|nr:MAG: hypothetical protein A2X01_18850 [Bacteroidetes bacterium GWF2_35_48]HBX53090.1 hypothetical protein [Bacteroidales bacterium]
MRNRIFILLMLVLFFLQAYGQYNGTVTTNLSELNFSQQDGYDIIQFKSNLTTEETGAPQLPVKILKYILPLDIKVSGVVVINSVIEQINGQFNIFPFQPPVPVSITTSSDFVDPNPVIYNSTNPYPNIRVEIIDDGYPMDYHVVTLKFYPVEYLPASKIVKLYKQINFTISYETAASSVQIPKRISRFSYDIGQSLISAVVENKSDLSSVQGGGLNISNNPPSSFALKFLPSLSTGEPDYIIITNDMFKEYFKPLADWKTRKGITTLIVTVEEISANFHGSDLAEKIRNYLIHVHSEWGTKFILLGGDIDIIPVRIGFSTYYGNWETDLYYSTVMGNWNANGNSIFGEGTDGVDVNPVFFLGRAPVSALNLQANPPINDVATFVKKVISYEQLKEYGTGTIINKNYVNNFLFLSAYLSNPPNVCFSSISADLENGNTYLSSNIKVLRLYDDYLNSLWNTTGTDQHFAELSKSNVIDALKNGSSLFPAQKFHIVYHMDHSKESNMGTSSNCHNQRIDCGDMDDLNNGPFYQILFTNGCEPNHFFKNSISKHYIKKLF